MSSSRRVGLGLHTGGHGNSFGVPLPSGPVLTGLVPKERIGSLQHFGKLLVELPPPPGQVVYWDAVSCQDEILDLLLHSLPQGLNSRERVLKGVTVPRGVWKMSDVLSFGHAGRQPPHELA